MNSTPTEGEKPMVSSKIEYHLVTQRGTIACIYEGDQALQRAEKAWFQKNDPSFKVLEVHTIKYDVTPHVLGKLAEAPHLSVVA
jgi:hypothetical protein